MSDIFELEKEDVKFTIKSKSQYQEHRTIKEILELIPLYMRCFDLVQIEREKKIKEE